MSGNWRRVLHYRKPRWHTCTRMNTRDTPWRWTTHGDSGSSGWSRHSESQLESLLFLIYLMERTEKVQEQAGETKMFQLSSAIFQRAENPPDFQVENTILTLDKH